MILEKATDTEHKFINEMLILSYENNNQGFAYPRGDIEDLENELKAYNLKINDCINIIKDNNKLIGIVGFIEYEANCGLIIGPTFIVDQYTFINVNSCLKLLLEMKNGECKTITNNILKENIILSEVLLKNNFIVSSSHITMRFELNNYRYDNNNINFDNITLVNINHSSQLDKIDKLFNDTLDDWIEEDIDSLYDYLNENYEIAVLMCEEKMLGAIIWVWFDTLGYGRIEYISVNKEEQRKGYGGKLIDYVKSKLSIHLTAELFNYLYIDMNEENKEAFALYLKKGFVVNYLDSVYKLIRE